MLQARRDMLAAALADLARPVEIWTAAERPEDPELAQLLALQPALSLHGPWTPPAEASWPADRYRTYAMSLPGEPIPRGNRFIGFPTGFSLDAFVDELVALSRGARLTSPLARETLARIVRPVTVRVLTSPG